MSLGQPDISIVVCTFNRADLLDECLLSLTEQSVEPSAYDVIVVDNNSTDNTADVVSRFQKVHRGLRLVTEENQGLSYARNRGFRAAKTDWVVYLDDDAKASKTFVERAMLIAQKSDFDCFGGVFLPWYKFGRPHWYKDSYVSNHGLMAKRGILVKGFACGGIFALKKAVLEKYDGFPVNLGMSGLRLAYGEENYLQKQIRNDGGTIGFDPEWFIEHLVSKTKLNPWWFVKSKYAVGRDSVVTYDLDWGWSLWLKKVAEAFGFLLLDTAKSSFRLFQRDFFMQNIIVEVFALFAWKIGMIVGILKHKLAKIKLTEK